MKKIMILPLIMVLFWACSVDNENELEETDGNMRLAAFSTEAATTNNISVTTCFRGITAGVQADVSNGLGNPVLVFTPAVTGSVTAGNKYTVRVEIQPLSDCDNMSSDTGSLIVYSYGTPVQNISTAPPGIMVQPSQIPACYKWRMVVDGVPDKKQTACTSITQWYEAPLF
jgi:hypothetical protein